MSVELQLPKVAVSQCLLGTKVRYDGTDSHCSLISDIANNHFEIVGVCPEVAIGMGVPRLPIRLQTFNDSIRAVRVSDNSEDFTDALKQYAADFARAHTDLVAIINKSRSPSCGYLTTRLFTNGALANAMSSGIFMDEIVKLIPAILVIDEIGLADDSKRHAFLDAIKKGPEQSEPF